MKETKIGFVKVVILLFGPWLVYGMDVDLFVHKDKFGKSLTLNIGERECTNVPRLWANLTMSVDTHGSCMQFYDDKNCKGKIAVIQPFHTVHQMDLSLIDFHNTIESVSPCGAKVPSGRYVIQSAVDASILTVQKPENEFARVNTLPPQAFVPKAQQWEISEKQPNEYDIMPRIHETNYPMTYDGEAMKKGSFIRKVWKIESVGRGRYVIKSEWTQKCLYKTRIRTVEEHDCRAWSPNQEWVLRPLIAPTPAPPTPDPQLADGVSFNVPSRVVDKYLEEQKRLREKERRKNKGKDREQDDRVAAYLEPYRIRYKKIKPQKESQEDRQEDDHNRDHYQPGKYRNTFQVAPPGPEVMYSQPAPVFSYEPRPPGKHPGKYLSYMDGISPVYDDTKVEDPVFPEFLLHAGSTEDGDLPRYQVTRRPFRPEPIGHPDYIPDKKKYDGRVKDKNFKPEQEEKPKQEEEDEESAEDDADNENERDPNSPHYDQLPQGHRPTKGQPNGQVKEESEEEVSQEDDQATESKEEDKDNAKESQEEDQVDKKEKKKVQSGHIGYDGSIQPVQSQSVKFNPNQPFGQFIQPHSPGYQQQYEQNLQQLQKEGQYRPKDKKKVEEAEEESQEDEEGEETSQEEQEEDIPETKEVKKPVKKEESKEELEEGDDPARDVASFMKMLFQGINNKMNKKDKVQSDMADMLARRDNIY